MPKTIHVKIIGAIIAGLIVGGITVIMLMTSNSKELANKTTQKSLHMLNNPYFKH